MKKLIAVGAALTFFTFVGNSPAFGGTNGPLATTDGSSVKFYNAGDYFHICDTDADGDSVYVSFHYSGSGGELRLNYTGGVAGGTNGCINRTYNIGEGKTVYYKSCESDAFRDTCSDYVTGVA